MIESNLVLIGAFVIIGLFTFSFRSIFLFFMPRIFTNDTIKNGLDSVPSALLVALVIPFTFFVSGQFTPFTIQAGAIIITVPIIYYLKRPGLSLPIAILVFVILTSLLTILGI